MISPRETASSAAANFSNNQILRAFAADPLLYFDSLARTPGSKQAVLDAVRERGADTVLRVCLAPVGDEMPLRALGYVASLLRLHRYLPLADLEIVTPVHTLQRVNQNRAAELAAHDLQRDLGVFTAVVTDLPKPFRLMTDSPELPAVDPERIRAVMAGTREEQRLMRQAELRGDRESYAAYVAGHMALYHTVRSVQPLLAEDDAPLSDARRVIVIAAQSERVFDNSLAHCREAGVVIEAAADAAGMVYTKFVRPPYLRSLPAPSGDIPYFDPMIPDYLALENPWLRDPELVRADPVKRDLVFTRTSVLASLGLIEYADTMLPPPTGR